jgi:hypothetical protein
MMPEPAIVVGRLEDGRPQVVCHFSYGLQTTWKDSLDENAQWVPWDSFPLPLPQNGLNVVTISLAMARRAALVGGHAEGANQGRLELFGLFALNAGGAPGFQGSYLYSISKASDDPEAAWGHWQQLLLPDVSVALSVTAAQVGPKNLELWL